MDLIILPKIILPKNKFFRFGKAGIVAISTK